VEAVAAAAMVVVVVIGLEGMEARPVNRGIDVEVDSVSPDVDLEGVIARRGEGDGGGGGCE